MAHTFKDVGPDDPISQIALRLIVERPDWQWHVVGTATLIAPNLALTARHNLDWICSTFGASKVANGLEVSDYEVRLVQALPGPIYRIWNVVKAWICATDIAILSLALTTNTSPDAPASISIAMSAFPPPVGQRIAAFGYRQSKVKVTVDAKGQPHIDLNDKGTTSSGLVQAIYPKARDSGLLCFPVFEVAARFDHGMSGGLVTNEQGRLCGLVCAGLKDIDANPSPVSYVATLWPMLATQISIGRGAAYPHDVSYPMIDLALDGFIDVAGLEQLDSVLFPERTPRPRK